MLLSVVSVADVKSIKMLGAAFRVAESVSFVCASWSVRFCVG